MWWAARWWLEAAARWGGASLYASIGEVFVFLPVFLLHPGFLVWVLYSGCLWETYRTIAAVQGQSMQLTQAQEVRCASSRWFPAAEGGSPAAVRSGRAAPGRAQSYL